MALGAATPHATPRLRRGHPPPAGRPPSALTATGGRRGPVGCRVGVAGVGKVVVVVVVVVVVG